MEPAATPPDEKHPDERAKREKAVLEKASAIKFEWRGLILAFNLPHVAPDVGFSHWDYVLREASWMAEDFGQERLWKQALAVRCAHEAAQFDRSKLKPTETKVLASVECDELGRVVCGESPHKDAEPTPSDPLEVTPAAPHPFPVLPYFYCSFPTLEAIFKNLEDEDVSRLARHSKAKGTYEELYEAARSMQPPSEDDLPSSSNKGLAVQAPGMAANAPATKRKMKQHSQSLGVLSMHQQELDDDLGLGPSSMMTGGSNVLKSARRVGDLDSTREKRKRKTRDFNDEDDYVPGSKNTSLPRDRFAQRTPSQLLARAEVTTSGGGGSIAGAGRGVSGGVPSSGNLRHAQRPKSSTGKPGTSGGLPRLDSMQGGPSGSGMTGNRGSFGSRGPGTADRMVTWSVQDDHVLAAIVTEFGLNWPLVADVLRTYSMMAGQYRRPEACKLRYATLKRIAAQEAAAAAEVEGGEQPPPPQPNMLIPLMNKSQARDTLAGALPVHGDVLKRHQGVLAVLASRLKNKRSQERMQLRESHKFRSEQHPSHYKILQSVNQVTGSKTLSPLDINPIEQPAPPPQMPGQPSVGPTQPPQGQHQGQGSMQQAQQAQQSQPMQQQQQQQQQIDGISAPSLQLGNVMVGGSPTFGALGQGQGQAQAPLASIAGAHGHAAPQNAAMAAGNRGKPVMMQGVASSGAMQQGQQGGMMGSGMMGVGLNPVGGLQGGAQPGGSGNGNMGTNQQMSANAARSPSPSMNFNNLNQQQKNMLQQLGRQGGMQQGGMMRPPLNPQQQQAMAAAAAAGRLGASAAGGAMSPALAAQIQKGLMQQAANNPAALQAIQAKMAAAAAAGQQTGQQASQQPGQSAQQGQGVGQQQPGQQGQPARQMTPSASGGNVQNPMLQGAPGSGNFGMQLGGTGGVGFGLPQPNTSGGMNLQQQYLAQTASVNAAPRSQPSNQGGNS